MDQAPGPSAVARNPAISRPHLLTRLGTIAGPRCVVLQGPAGFGKTSLLTAWRREMIAAGCDVAWVALGTEDDSPGRLVEALMTSLGVVDASLLREASVLAGRGNDDDAAEGLLIAIVRAIASYPRNLAIVFDDAHHLTDAAATRILQMLLEYGPAGMRCAFATRSVLPLALGRLRAQGQLLEFGLDELRFTPDESARLAANLLGGVDARTARSLHDFTDGWAAGLRLLCSDSRRQRRVLAPGTGIPVRDAQAFAQYFEREVLGQLSPDQTEYLLRCTVSDAFDARLCAALLEPSPDTATSEHILHALERHGLFIVPAGPRYPPGWWRLHPLLRGVLEARLQAVAPALRQQWHTRAWHFFSARGMTHDAVHHAMLAGAADEAAALVEASAPGLFTRGELRRIVGLVRLLPESIVRQHPSLRFWLAWAQLYELRLTDCAHSIDELQQALESAPATQRYRLTLLRGLLAVQQDDSTAAAELLSALQAPPPDADGIVLTGRRSLLTWIHLYNGEYDRAREEQAAEPIPLVDGQPLWGTAIGLLAGRCLAGLSHAVQGQVIDAERIYRDVLLEAERRGPTCADAGTLAAALLGEVLYELNDAHAALVLLEPRLEVMERVSIPDTRLRMMLVLNRSRWLTGRPLDALDCLEQNQDHAERAGLDRLLAYVLLEQLQLHLRQGDPGQALEPMRRLETLDERHARVQTGALSEIRVVAERARIRMDLHTGNLDPALQRLEALTGLCRCRGRTRRIPFLNLQAAAVRRQLRQHAQSRALVCDALRQGNQLGLMRTLLDAHDDVPRLIADAIADPELDGVLRFYAERLQTAATGPGTGPPAAARPALPGAERLSPREAEIVDLLLANLSNKRIARALDLSLDTVKWHLKNVYGKLGVSGRDEVVQRLKS